MLCSIVPGRSSVKGFKVSGDAGEFELYGKTYTVSGSGDKTTATVAERLCSGTGYTLASIHLLGSVSGVMKSLDKDKENVTHTFDEGTRNHYKKMEPGA